MADTGGGNDNNKSEKSPSEEEMKLPPGWTKGFSNSQKKTYFCHPASKHTQWHFPTASEAKDPTKAKKRLQEAQGSSEGTKSSSSHSQSTLGDIVSKATMSSSRVQHQEQPKKRQRLSNNSNSQSYADSTCVAIIVPYRDIHVAQNRAKHLQKFIPHMHSFLQKQLNKKTLVDYHIYIIEQSNDQRKFNRGKLLNIGFDIARKNKCRNGSINHDIFIFHDVDLLPGDDLGAEYTKFPKVPVHIARVWDRYSNNNKYFGGIVSFSASDMKRINGYPNTFWGWGGEDDEMQNRCEKLGIKWQAPNRGTITDLEEMDLKEKLDFLRTNRKWKCMVKWEALEEHDKTWRINGLADLNYKVVGMVDLDKNSHAKGRDSASYKSRATKITVDVKLNGNHWANEKCGMDFVWKG